MDVWVCGQWKWVDGFFFFFKQKTAYEIGTGDWSSDVCLPISDANEIYMYKSFFSEEAVIYVENMRHLVLPSWYIHV